MYQVDKTRKHYNSQMYMKGFARPDHSDQVYVFDKRQADKGILFRSVGNVEVSRDAYSVKHDQILTERETVWSEILRTLEHSQVSELNDYISDRVGSTRLRQWLARFVVDSALRSQGLRERMKPFLTESFISLDRQIAAILEDSVVQEPSLEHELRLIDSLVGGMTHRGDLRKQVAILLAPFLCGEEGERYYEWYEQGSWRFDEPPIGRTFITSDVPSTTLLLGRESQYENWMWFAIPLSKKLRLMGLCGDARRETGLIPRPAELDDDEMDAINGIVFRHAERNVYASSKEELERAIRLAADVA